MSFAALKDTKEKKVHVGQGEHHITSDPDVVLSTILGELLTAAIPLRDRELTAEINDQEQRLLAG